MPMFAVKIGEIHLYSDSPITDEQRQRAMSELGASIPISTTSDGLEVAGLLNVETAYLRKR